MVEDVETPAPAAPTAEAQPAAPPVEVAPEAKREPGADRPAPVPGPVAPPQTIVQVQVICDPMNLKTMQISHPDDRLMTVQILAYAVQRLAAAIVHQGNTDGPPGVKPATAAQLKNLPTPEKNGKGRIHLP